ncbi:MAG TPA: alpha/beta family hydrolase [Jatrophihabitans sp.]|nr:alpha/beta family hydrolase [Jatrophihabitans sp.]
MRFEIATPSGPARVVLDRPAGPPAALLVLTHGAGGGVDTADVRAVCTAARVAGIVTAAVTQPYRVAGRSSPPAPGRQDDAWLAAIAGIRRRRGLSTLPLFVGGRSNGARVACRTALASGAAGVVALAFPVHPPGRPDNSRLPELDAAGVPVLVVQGDRDPFGMPAPGPDREIVVVPGADHALRRDVAAIADAVVAFVTSQIAHAKVAP